MAHYMNLLFTMRVFRKDLPNYSHTVVWRTVVNKHIFYIIVRLSEKCSRALFDISLYTIYWNQYGNLHHLLDRDMLKLTIQERHQF